MLTKHYDYACVLSLPSKNAKNVQKMNTCTVTKDILVRLWRDKTRINRVRQTA